MTVTVQRRWGACSRKIQDGLAYSCLNKVPSTLVTVLMTLFSGKPRGRGGYSKYERTADCRWLVERLMLFDGCSRQQTYSERRKQQQEQQQHDQQDVDPYALPYLACVVVHSSNMA